MNPATLSDLAAKHGQRLPRQLQVDQGSDELDALHFPADRRGWFRFQRLYDIARACVRDEADLRRIIREAAVDDASEGSRRLEMQIDPTSYAPYVGGLTAALEIFLDEAKIASAATGVEIGIIVAASRTRHPLDARTLARLAAHHAGDGPGEVVGFGLSNDERAGRTSEFAQAFHIAKRAGLISVPHGGELLGPDHLEVVLDELAPDRVGHGIRAAEDPAMLDRIAAAGQALEVCPGSNVHLGVYPSLAEVPLRAVIDAGIEVALGADDPLLFSTRLVDQYEAAREALGFTDPELAELARSSIRASTASAATRARALADIDAWLAAPAAASA